MSRYTLRVARAAVGAAYLINGDQEDLDLDGLYELAERDHTEYRAKGSWCLMVILLAAKALRENPIRSVIESVEAGLLFTTPPENNCLVLPRHTFPTDAAAIRELKAVAGEYQFPRRRSVLYSRAEHNLPS